MCYFVGSVTPSLKSDISSGRSVERFIVAAIFSAFEISPAALRTATLTTLQGAGADDQSIVFPW